MNVMQYIEFNWNLIYILFNKRIIWQKTTNNDSIKEVVREKGRRKGRRNNKMERIKNNIK